MDEPSDTASRRTRGRPRAEPKAGDTPTEEQILEAAGEVFAEFGFAGASTREIARRAGLRQPSLYHYFPNKAAMLTALIEQAGEGSLAIFRKIDALQAPAAVKLYRATYLESRMLAGWPDYLKVVCQLPELRQPRHVHFIEIRDRIIAWYQKTIADGVAASEFRTVDPLFVGWLINGANEAIFDQAPITPRLEPDAHARAVASFVLCAVIGDPRQFDSIVVAADLMGAD